MPLPETTDYDEMFEAIFNRLREITGLDTNISEMLDALTRQHLLIRVVVIEECAHKVRTASVQHGDHLASYSGPSSDADELANAVLSLKMKNALPSVFVLSETDICALMRQLHNVPISTEGTSGPKLHDLLRRLQKHIGPERYAEFVEGEWPKRLKTR